MKRERNKRIFLLLFCSVALFIVIFSSVLFPASNELDMKTGLQGPSMQHIFGTDNLGRDLLQRSFAGLSLSLALAFAIQLAALGIGTAFGILSGYYGGIVDRLFVIVQNVLMSFPSMIASLCMLLLLGNGIHTLIIALTVVEWVSYARLVRSRVVSLRNMNFIRGAKAVGVSDFRILAVHIVPNVIRPIIPLFTLMIGHTVLSISGLGFLGFGIQPPTAEIGLMIRDGLTYINKAPWMFLLPGLLLVAYSLLFNMVGDDLQDWLNPQNELYNV